MCTSARGTFNLTGFWKAGNVVVTIAQSQLGPCTSIYDSECAYLLKYILLCFMDIYTNQLTYYLIYLYVLKMYPVKPLSKISETWHPSFFSYERYYLRVSLLSPFYIFSDYLSSCGELLKKNVVCLVLSVAVYTGTGVLCMLTHRRGLWC